MATSYFCVGGFRGLGASGLLVYMVFKSVSLLEYIHGLRPFLSILPSNSSLGGFATVVISTIVIRGGL